MGDAVYSTLRFIARHLRGFFGPLVAVLGIGFVVSAAAILAFGALAHSVTGGFTQRVDERALLWLEAHRTPLLDSIATEVTMLGNGAVIAMVVTVAAVFLFLTRHRISALLLVAATLGGMILNVILKDIFDRPRPSVVDWISDPSSASFPSGHAMTAIVGYGAVALLVGRLGPTSRLRHATWLVAALLILAIGATRLYLGVHYPSDVVAGFAAGLAWLAFVNWGISAVQFFAPRRPGISAEEKDLQADSAQAQRGS